MRFQKIKFYAEKQTGSDPLGNPITEPVLIGLYEGSISPWSVEEIALLDREVTRTRRKLITDAPKTIVRQTDRIEIDGEIYKDLEVVTDTVRWRICHVRGYFH